MTYCREAHTLVDNEAEGDWEQLIPGTFFTLIVDAVTYFGIVDEYKEPTTTDLICRLYSDAARTILVTTSIPTALPYTISDFAAFSWSKSDLQNRLDGSIGTWISPSITVRDDTGIWIGNWRAEPKPVSQGSEVEFIFSGTHTLFTVSVENLIIAEVAGSGLAAGTYEYAVAPVDTGVLIGAGSRIVTITLAGAADIRISWRANNLVTSWNIYGRKIGAAFGLQANVTGATITYLDNGVDTPVPGCPPLIEPVSWITAVPNREVVVVDDDGSTIGDIDPEGPPEIIDDGGTGGGGTIVDTDADGDFEHTDINGLKFDITGLTCTSVVTHNVVLDPNLFINSPLPPDQQAPLVTSYDYHVYIASSGFTVIEETDSGTEQTKRVIVNTTTNKFDIEVIENSVIIASASIDIDPDFTIPTVGSLTVVVTYTEIRVLPDGVILGTESVSACTFDVVPQNMPGTLVVLNSAVAADHRIKISVNSALTWTNTTLASKISPPFSFDLEDSALFWGHGEGWTILITVDDPNIALVTDMGFHWTNDPTLATWPFNDNFGRVAQGALTQAAFDRIWGSGVGFGPTVIIAPANEIGVMVYTTLVGSADEIRFGSSSQEFNVFFPATGVFTSITWVSVGGPLNMLSYTVWSEKNMLIGVEDSSNKIHIWDLTISQAAPLANHRQVASLIEDPGFGFFKICHSPTEIFIHYGDAASLDVRTARSSDGISWSHVLHNSTGDFDPATAGQEIIGMLPDHWAYVRDLSKYIFTAVQTIFSSSDADSWSTTVKAANTLDQEFYEYLGTNFNPESSQPILWDGTLLSLGGPDDAASGFPGTFQRFDSAFVDASPLTGGSSGGTINGTQGSQGVTVASLADPDNIPLANVRGFIGRPVETPDSVAAIPNPFRIRNVSISPVFDSVDTVLFSTTPLNVERSLRSTQRGGIGNATYVRLQNGNIILRTIPSAVPVDVFEKWQAPHINLRLSTSLP